MLLILSTAVYMLPVFVLQIYSSNKPQILSTAAWNSIPTNAGSLVFVCLFVWFFFSQLFIICLSFYCILLMLLIMFLLEFGQKTKASLQAVCVCVCLRLRTLLVKLCAIMWRSDAYKLFLSKFIAITYLAHSIEFNIVYIMCICAAAPSLSAGENCALKFWFCYFHFLPFQLNVSSRHRGVSKSVYTSVMYQRVFEYHMHALQPAETQMCAGFFFSFVAFWYFHSLFPVRLALLLLILQLQCATIPYHTMSNQIFRVWFVSEFWWFCLLNVLISKVFFLSSAW